MTTAHDVVGRALRLIGVVDPTETPEAQQMQNGVDALNQMMHGWRLQGVDVQHTNLVLADDLIVPPELIGGVTALLAINLAAEYPGTAVPASTVSMAQAGWDGIQAAYISRDTELRVDRALLQTGPFRRTRYLRP